VVVYSSSSVPAEALPVGVWKTDLLPPAQGSATMFPAPDEAIVRRSREIIAES